MHSGKFRCRPGALTPSRPKLAVRRGHRRSWLRGRHRGASTTPPRRQVSLRRSARSTSGSCVWMSFQLRNALASWSPLSLLVVPSLALLKSMRERPRLEIEAARTLERSWDAHFVERVSCRYSSLPTLPVHPIIVSPIFRRAGGAASFMRLPE